MSNENIISGKLKGSASVNKNESDTQILARIVDYELELRELWRQKLLSRISEVLA